MLEQKQGRTAVLGTPQNGSGRVLGTTRNLLVGSIKISIKI